MTHRLIVIAPALLVFSSLCFPQEEPSPELEPRNEVKVPEGEAVPEPLKERITGYWQARMTKNSEQMYSYYTPTYRKETSPEQFLQENERLFQLEIVSFEVKNLVYEDEAQQKTRVRITYVTDPRIFTGRYRVLKEDQWVKLEDEWFMIHQKAPSPFIVRKPQ